MRSALALAVVLQTAGLAGANGAAVGAVVGIGALLFSRGRLNGALLVALSLLQLGLAVSDGALPGRAARILAPLALMWLGTARGEAALRLGAGLTFFAHGLKALQGSPAFVALIQGTGRNVLGWDIGAGAAREALALIGIVDILLAVAVLTVRSRGVAAYMAGWGFLTALSRITGLGLDAFPETLIRAANGAVPLALWLLWARPPKKKGPVFPGKRGPCR